MASEQSALPPGLWEARVGTGVGKGAEGVEVWGPPFPVILPLLRKGAHRQVPSKAESQPGLEVSQAASGCLLGSALPRLVLLPPLPQASVSPLVQ